MQPTSGAAAAQPRRLHKRRGQCAYPIGFTGLWDMWTMKEDGEFKSVTLMTGPLERHLAEPHDRAPVILLMSGARLATAQDAKA